MHDLGDFSLHDVAECAARLRRLGQGAGSMEEAAGRIVTYLYDDLGGPRRGQRACALVRFYKTHPYGLLDAGRRRVASAHRTGEAASPDAPYLALLATTGDEPSWRSVKDSHGHQAIPFASAEHAAHLPTMLRLVESAERPDEPEDALTHRHGIRSVLGFGGQLPAGDLFAVVLFTRVSIGAEARRLFQTLGLAVKVGVMAFARGPIFS